MNFSHRSNVLRAYRELVALLRRLPQDKQLEGLQEARTLIRQNRDLADPVAASDKLKELVARISFLHMTLPRRPGDRRLHKGSGTYVLRDGHLVKSEGAQPRGGPGQMSMDEAYRKHNELVRRQHFGRTPPPMPMF